MNSFERQIDKPLDRLKVLINSSTPIVVMETVEELRALSLVRMACSELSVAVFEWTIADGLVRSGSARSPRSARYAAFKNMVVHATLPRVAQPLPSSTILGCASRVP